MRKGGDILGALYRCDTQFPGLNSTSAEANFVRNSHVKMETLVIGRLSYHEEFKPLPKVHPKTHPTRHTNGM